MYRRNRSKARAWTNTTWSRVRKVGSKSILCQINMIQMFQGHPWHPGCNTAQYLVSSCRPGAAASSSQLQKLISQGWRPVNINRFYIQLQNVSSSVQKGPNVGLCSPKVSVHKLFNVAGNTGWGEVDSTPKNSGGRGGKCFFLFFSTSK